MNSTAGLHFVTRRKWLLAGFVFFPHAGPAAAELVVRPKSDGLHVSAPGLHFLAGKSLERLRDGASVFFDFQLALLDEAKVRMLARTLERFAVSYDLWEEKFAVTSVQPVRKPVSNLSARAAENWCIEQLAVSTESLSPQRRFWVRLDVRSGDAGERASVVGDPGINLTSLIEIFSRTTRSQNPRWSVEAGPMRLGDLRQSGGKDR